MKRRTLGVKSHLKMRKPRATKILFFAFADEVEFLVTRYIRLVSTLFMPHTDTIGVSLTVRVFGPEVLYFDCSVDVCIQQFSLIKSIMPIQN